MQTFLPYPDFVASAKALDYRRLGKQRLECEWILRGSRSNHPAAKMWDGHQYQLAEYGKVICLEWIARGYKDTRLNIISGLQISFSNTGLPPWFGDPAFHEAHQSNLIRKFPEYYRKQFPHVKEGLGYIWPINME